MGDVIHPATVAQDEQRSEDWQLKLADSITKFAGSMAFVWVHTVLFVMWIVVLGYVVKTDPFPFNFLTMTVSLEAIFLATFVMIGQNRQADFAARKAAHDFVEQEKELKTNTALTREVHEMTGEIRKLVQPKARRRVGKAV